MAGDYVSSDFHFASGATGTIITDPVILDGGSVHRARIALLGSYIASFAADGHGGFVTNTLQTEQQPPLLAQPHG